jgi:hypothetical protein
MNEVTINEAASALGVSPDPPAANALARPADPAMATA